MSSKRQRNAKEGPAKMKVPVGLYPNVARIRTAMVFAQSACDYGQFNWRNSKVSMSVYLDAMERHLIALRAGQNNDAESKMPHLAHINACTAILLDAQALDKLIDDRIEKDRSADLLKLLTPARYRAAKQKLKSRPARTLDQVRRLRRPRK